MAIRFDGKVAIVTGAGGGLGRAHALELARRGAKVVVNDLGGSLDGSGGGSDAAKKVVEEIIAAGGEAIANGASVTDNAGVANLVKETMDKWGRIDILICNAGILRDRSFPKMTLEDFEAVLNVHLWGTVKPVKAVWDIMKAQKYGRIVVTTSSTGLYGNFGQANYGTAKMAVIGLMQTLKIEGQKDNIRVNAISPVAATRMTDSLMTDQTKEEMAPDWVSGGVMVLVSDDAPTGTILTGAGGVFAASQVIETRGVFVGSKDADVVLANWDKITDGSGSKAYFMGNEQGAKFFELSAEGRKK